MREGDARENSGHERVDLVARGSMVVDEVLDVGKDKLTRIELRQISWEEEVVDTVLVEEVDKEWAALCQSPTPMTVLSAQGYTQFL